jgi:hypothetical protein
MQYSTSRKIPGLIPIEVIPFLFFNLPKFSGRIMALGLTQTITEIITRDLKVKGWPAHKAENPTVISEPIA